MIWTELSSCKASRTLLLHCCSGQPDQQKRWSSHRLAPLLMQVQLCSKQFNQSSFISSKRNIFFTLFLSTPPPLPSPTFFLSLSPNNSHTTLTQLSPTFFWDGNMKAWKHISHPETGFWGYWAIDTFRSTCLVQPVALCWECQNNNVNA